MTPLYQSGIIKISQFGIIYDKEKIKEGISMKLFKKIVSAITAMAIAVSACASMALTVSAKSIYDTAKEIESGTKYTSTHPNTWDCADYKVVVTDDGDLSINITAGLLRCILFVYDSDGGTIDCENYNIKSGSLCSIKDGIEFEWNQATEKIVVSATYKVSKGTYYIRVKDDTMYGSSSYKYGSRKVEMSATFPSKKQAKINYITINLEKGDSVSLGASFSEGSGTVTWKSSKSSVATISSNGKVTANVKGSAIITAKCGSSTKKIKIVVS